VLAAVAPSTALIFIEVGAIALGLSLLARLAGRLGITPIPFYLLAGLTVGRGGAVQLDLSESFIGLGAEIGVLLLLLTLGLEYTADELGSGLKTGLLAGAVDAALNFAPGFLLGLILGWGPVTAALLGGVTWISSSGVVSKVLTDFDRLGNRETPAVLNLLVMEDLAMAIYLPVIAAVLAGTALLATVITVGGALVVVALILVVALRWGHGISALMSADSDEALLLGIFGLTLLVAGLAQQVEVSSAIGAFLVGLAVSGPVQLRAGPLIHPLRDLFAATFFFFFSFQLDPGDVLSAMGPAIGLAAVGTATKVATGWWICSRLGPKARLRAGMTLVARGEFSIVIATLGAGAAAGAELTSLAAAFVLVTAVVGPVLAKYADRLPVTRPPALAT
jgi:monovalent cation:H+ antiporter-2, CPA2 family